MKSRSSIPTIEDEQMPCNTALAESLIRQKAGGVGSEKG